MIHDKMFTFETAVDGVTAASGPARSAHFQLDCLNTTSSRGRTDPCPTAF